MRILYFVMGFFTWSFYPGDILQGGGIINETWRHAMILCMKFDVVIIGGGLVGASLAAALKHSGLSLALVESQPLLMPGNASASNARSPHPNPLPVESPSPQ